jgi:hypothetical protein
VSRIEDAARAYVARVDDAGECNARPEYRALRDAVNSADPVATALAALGEAAVKWVANNGNAQSSGSLFVAARAYAEAAKHGSDAE